MLYEVIAVYRFGREDTIHRRTDLKAATQLAKRLYEQYPENLLKVEVRDLYSVTHHIEGSI